MPGASRRGIAVVAAAVALLVLVPPNVGASATPASVLLCTDRLNVRTGDVVNLTLYTLRAASLVDAASIAVLWGPSGARWPVDMTWASTGVYRGSFLVNVTNPSSFGDGIQLEAQVAYVDGAGAYGGAFVLLQPAHSLEVELTPSSYWLHPGGTSLLDVRVSDGGQPVDVTNLTVTVEWLGWGFQMSSTVVPWLRTGVGAYEARFVVPGDLYVPWVGVMAGATLGNASGLDYRLLSVLLPQPFSIWIHALDAGPESFGFEVFVSQEDATALAGATVAFNYTGQNGFPPLPETGEMSARTDVHGRASFNLSHSPITASALLVGNVTAGSARQGFATLVSSVVPPSPGSPFEFEVRRSDPWGFVAANENATLRYRALSRGQPLVHVGIDYYTSSPLGLLAFGHAQTDDTGTFSIETPVPAYPMDLTFFSNGTGGWQAWSDQVHPEYRLALSIDPLRPGGVSRGAGTVPDGLAPWEMFSSVVPLDASGALPDTTWQPAILGGFLPDGLVLGPTFQVNQTFPVFLPKGRSYLRSVSLQPYSRPEPGLAHWTPNWDFRELLTIPNLRPVARLNISNTDPASGEPIRINASSSSDADGWVDAYEIDWGDGDWTNWVAESSFEHVYRVGGDFVLTVHIRDDSGGYNTTSVVMRVAPALFGVRLSILLPVAGSIAAIAALGVAWTLHSRRKRGTERLPDRQTTPARDEAKPPERAPRLEEPRSPPHH